MWIARQERWQDCGRQLSLYTLLQILTVTFFEKMPMQQVFPEIDYSSKNHQISKQLNLFNFRPDPGGIDTGINESLYCTQEIRGSIRLPGRPRGA